MAQHPPIPRITLPTGTEVELPLDLWQTASYVATIDTPGGLVLVPVLVTAEDPQHPRVYGAFSLTDAASRRLVRQLDEIRARTPPWLRRP